LGEALERQPESNLAVISVPGSYAAQEARKALEHGLNVFLFSDNVAMEDELALKHYAQERRLIVMGPDCGTAIVAGIGLGFANAVRRGPIGVIGASGTGLQEFPSLVHQSGSGIHAIAPAEGPFGCDRGYHCLPGVGSP
jgi:FdrA protein